MTDFELMALLLKSSNQPNTTVEIDPKKHTISVYQMYDYVEIAFDEHGNIL